MRIGIITQPLNANYGGILQNYALQQVLLRMGHSPVTIDFLPDRHLGDRIKHLVWSFLHFKKPNKWIFRYRRSGFAKRFIRKNILATHIVQKYRTGTVKFYRLQALIAGSDQIWRPKYNSYLEDMFFSFAEKLPVKKIVYGASFGTDEWEYSPKMTEDCRTLARRIVAVSVREKSGIALCRRHFGIEAQLVLDPTLLLDAANYEQLCAHIPHSEHAFLAVYLLDVDEHLTAEIEKTGKSLDLPIRVFSSEPDASLTVEGWLAMFRDAKYVITDSFHGTVFSIIFNKPFVAIGNCTRGMSRFHSLLEQFGLEERLSTTSLTDILLHPILWDEVNERKRALGECSIRFLENNLSTH